VREFFQSLAGSLDATAMRKLNAAVDKDKRRPEDVAREFLVRRVSAR
jgi:glycine betaine/choline ABC-type transport system substrate-binding protein